MPRPPAEPKTEFARRLRQLRTAYGTLVRSDPKYTADAFAKELGIEAETYRTYERGDSQPNLETLAKIRQVTQHSLDTLICGAAHKEERRAPAKGTVPFKRRA
jgi:transcriptional regulator with XRE-family HTH domain